MMVVPCCIYGQEQISLDHQFSLGSPSLSIRLPGKPEPMETRIQPSMLEIIMAYYAYAYVDSVRGITVMLLQTSYAQHIHPDMAIISDQTIRELESRGALSVKYKTKTINIEGKKGIRQKGTLVSKGDEMDFTSSILQEGTNVWKVIIYTRVGDAVAAQTAQAIMDSITFKLL
ncbi:MAG: hypothetical protein IPP15_06415 [Saprospiraceae bacterium]|uniref:Uncharacterized protein n=1 Tax=Candidatus Opimibacter skivensis TaxID=2982028 RepID=A0A9D7SRN4_9BACT|nr:hypothetical protein [Candidatus Opimibacter skivensis]